MEAGKIAAETIIEGLAEGDLSIKKMKLYHERWKSKFGFEFWLYAQVPLTPPPPPHSHSPTILPMTTHRGGVLLHLLYRFPILLDAGAEVIKRKGDGFVGAWATVMLCVCVLCVCCVLCVLCVLCFVCFVCVCCVLCKCVFVFIFLFQAMMGGRSKMWFLYPTCAGPILFEACLQWLASWLDLFSI